VGCATEIFRDKRVRTQEVGRVLQRFLGKKLSIQELRRENHYSQAAKYIEHDSSFSEEKQSKALKISCKLNCVACKLKLKE